MESGSSPDSEDGWISQIQCISYSYIVCCNSERFYIISVSKASLETTCA